MEYKIEAPPEFTGVFTYCYFTENTTGEAIVQRLLPSFQTMLVFCFNGSFRLLTEENEEIFVERSILLGPVKRSFSYTIPAGGQMLVVNFRDGAFYRLFGMESIGDVWEDLNGLRSFGEQVECLLDFFRTHLGETAGLADRLREAMGKDESVIKSVAAEAGMSERSVQQWHKRIFGFTAKERDRYDRFWRAVRALQGRVGEDVDWMELVVEAGYYDQSQMIHDFQYYMGLPPRKYLAFQAGICVVGR